MVFRTIQENGSGSILCVIPKPLLESAGLNPGDKVDVRFENQKIILMKAAPILSIGLNTGLVYLGLAAFNIILPNQIDIIALA